MGLPPLGRGLLLTLALASCATADPLDRLFGPSGRTIRQEIAEWPEERRAQFEVVRSRCTACHTLDPVFATHVAPGNWTVVVSKMARRPGAAIPDEQQPVIVDFLEHFSARRIAPER